MAEMSDFSAEEFQGRLDRVRGVMAERGLDALVVFDEEKGLGRGSVQYLSGYYDVQVSLVSSLVVPLTGQPALCIDPGFAYNNLTWASLISDFKAKASTAQRHGNRFGADFLTDIPAALHESGITRGRVGVDGTGIMPARLLDGLRERLTGVEIVHVDGLIEGIRFSKTDAEIAVIRQANQAGKAAIDAFAEMAQPGADQALAVIEGEHAAYALGTEDVTILMSGGAPWVWGGRRRRGLRFQGGDTVVAEVFARYHGYYGHLCRTVFVGEVDGEKRHMLEAEKAAHDRMLSILKPGVTAQELFRKGLAELESWGYEHSGMRFGHGVGLAANENFVVWEGDTTALPEGAYGTVHPMMIGTDATGRGQFNILYGDPWVLRASGPELLL
jgi:Xaa-Pro aminopeptidase